MAGHLERRLQTAMAAVPGAGLPLAVWSVASIALSTSHVGWAGILLVSCAVPYGTLLGLPPRPPAHPSTDCSSHRRPTPRLVPSPCRSSPSTWTTSSRSSRTCTWTSANSRYAQRETFFLVQRFFWLPAHQSGTHIPRHAYRQQLSAILHQHRPADCKSGSTCCRHGPKAGPRAQYSVVA